MYSTATNFIEIKEQAKAEAFIDLFNQFYTIRRKRPKEKWKDESLKVYHTLVKELRKIDRDPESSGNHILSKAAAYCRNKLESTYNIIASTDYDWDNNVIECPMRYVHHIGKIKSVRRLLIFMARSPA